MRSTLKAYRRNLPLWAIPMLYVGVTVVCSFVLSVLDSQDRVMAMQEDRQGLGLSRPHTEAQGGGVAPR